MPSFYPAAMRLSLLSPPFSFLYYIYMCILTPTPLPGPSDALRPDDQVYAEPLTPHNALTHRVITLKTPLFLFLREWRFFRYACNML